MPKPDSWGTAFRCASRPLFRQTGLKKMRELYILCLEGGLKTTCQTLWRNFSSNKSAPANRKKGFYTSRLQRTLNSLKKK
jgi:hypothetical protein